VAEKKKRSFLSYMKQGAKPYKAVSQLSLIEKSEKQNNLDKDFNKPASFAVRTTQWSETRFFI